MAEIIDLMKHRIETGDLLTVDDTMDALDVFSILQALEDVTQEINYIVHYYNDSTLFPGAEARKKKTAKGAKLFTNGKLYNLHQLLKQHAANLYRTADYLQQFIEEPTNNEKAQLSKQREQMATEYRERRNPFVCKYMEACGEIVLQEVEKLRQREEGRPQE